MPEQIYIGNFPKGQVTNRSAFVIDNDAFPNLFNFYVWRGRAKRKRGTIFLGQLQIQEQIAAVPLSWQLLTFNLLAGGANLVTQYTLGATSSITPGSLTIIVAGDQTYTDANKDGTLQGNAGGTGTINYATGAFTVSGSPNGAVTGTFSYFPGLPVMGLRNYDYISVPGNANVSSIYPFLLSFDTIRAFQIVQTAANTTFYDVSYYKQTNNPVVWSGGDFQQFWTTNFQSACWATNNKPGFHFVNGTYTSGSGTANITFNFKSNAANLTTLIIGDVLWFNEWNTGGSNINGITGTVSDNSGAAAGNYVVTFTANKTVAGVGIAQLLTNSIVGQDGIKWYDGDPTSTTGLPTSTLSGWVNFAPPLSAGAAIIDNLPIGANPYYLVGALAIVAFKDRLVFFSPWVRLSNGLPVQLQDVALWSWNGTAYYTVSALQNGATPPVASVVPVGQTADPRAYYFNQTGLGGYQAAGIALPITTVSNNEDVLLVGFGGVGRKTRFVYTGNDLQPFLWYTINSELPSDSTFSSITLDKGAIDLGVYGIAMTDQQSSTRIDLDIPDNIFQIQAQNNGVQRVNAVRDFQNEWIYFSYPIYNSGNPSTQWRFPTQTFLFNYRDNTWAILYENYTAHGTYRPLLRKSWLTTGFKSWNAWREPWNSGAGAPLYPNIVAGNPQGYVLMQGEGTGEGPSGTIQAIGPDANNNTQITSIDHCVQVNDYIYVTGALNLLSSTITAITLGNPTIITTVNTFVFTNFVTISGVVGTTQLNGNSYEVLVSNGVSITIAVDSTNFTPYVSGGVVTYTFNGLIGRVISTASANVFVLDIPAPPFNPGGYLGAGKFTRLSQPLIQTKQFNPYWDQGRQMRLSAQKYLLDSTANSQVTVNIYLSQDPDDAWNAPPDNPGPNSLVYSQIMYTCPESANIGLTPANTNLQMPTAANQNQIWHRFNTSMIGDSVQIGITLSDAQMRNLIFATSEIALQGIHLSIDKGPHLA